MTRKLDDFSEFEATRRELEALYGRKLKVFAGEHHARYFPENVPVHVISRIFQGRYLLKPNRQLRKLVAGVLGRAQRVFPLVKLYATAFLSNHFHAMLSGPAAQLAAFIAHVKREISRRWGETPGVNWPGTMWSTYLATALPSAASQIQCLKYILSQGVKEKLVDKPQQWPGVHSARTLMSGSRMIGEWLHGTALGRAQDAQSRRKRPKPVRKADFYETYEVKHVPIPAWAHLSAEDYKVRVRRLVDEIVEEGRIARGGKPPLGVKAVLAIPLNHRSDLPPQPWFEKRKRLICWGDPRDAEVQQFIDDYWTFQRAFRAASKAFLEGDGSAVFPRYAFKPGGPPPDPMRTSAAA
jgi:REP element-mobilizing transposase RayT